MIAPVTREYDTEPWNRCKGKTHNTSAPECRKASSTEVWNGYREKRTRIRCNTTKKPLDNHDLVRICHTAVN